MKNITELILKFMESLDFKEKCSPHTIVAYGCDLQQTFQKYLPGDLHGPGINGAENYVFVSTEDTPAPLPCPLHTKDLEVIVRTYIHSIRSLEPASRARKVATLRRFFSFLKTENIVDEMPRLLTTPKAVQKLPHFLSVDEALTILKLFSKNELDTRELNSKILFLLLYGVGLRVSEACNLEWQQINLTKRELRIKGKGNKERIISMPQLVQLNLATLRSSQNKKYIWGDKPLLTRTAYNYIVHIGKRAQLTKPIHPHALRHSYATHLMNDGADLRVIQELLGHASLVATEKYTHVSMDQLSRTMESFHPLSKKIV